MGDCYLTTHVFEYFMGILRKLNDFLGFPKEFGWQFISEIRLFRLNVINKVSIPYHYKIWQYNRRGDLKINLGCGKRRENGWIGIDGSKGAAVDLQHDLRKKLPLRDKSVSFIYSEHFLEHIEQYDAEVFLSNCFRILKFEGAIRIVVPDVEKHINAYLTKNVNFYQIASPNEIHPTKSFNVMLRHYGLHKYYYDYELLKEMLISAGFSNVEKSNYNESKYSELRIDSSDEQRITESLYVEAIKKQLSSSPRIPPEVQEKRATHLG